MKISVPVPIPVKKNFSPGPGLDKKENFGPGTGTTFQIPIPSIPWDTFEKVVMPWDGMGLVRCPTRHQISFFKKNKHDYT